MGPVMGRSKAKAGRPGGTGLGFLPASGPVRLPDSGVLPGSGPVAGSIKYARIASMQKRDTLSIIGLSGIGSQMVACKRSSPFSFGFLGVVSRSLIAKSVLPRKG